MSLEQVPTIGLDGEQRVDHALRAAFVRIFETVAPYMDAEGHWLSNLHEAQALGELAEKFPELTGLRQFAVLARVANVKASGRTPT